MTDSAKMTILINGAAGRACKRMEGRAGYKSRDFQTLRHAVPSPPLLPIPPAPSPFRVHPKDLSGPSPGGTSALILLVTQN